MTNTREQVQTLLDKVGYVASPQLAMAVAMMFFIVMTAIIFTRFLTVAGVIDTLLSFITGRDLPPVTLLFFFMVGYVSLHPPYSLLKFRISFERIGPL